IHSAAIDQIGVVTYYNCGDWVESCTALVEHHDGKLELVTYPAFPRSSAGGTTSAGRALGLNEKARRGIHWQEDFEPFTAGPNS
ncbi:MAG: hypothetical protein ABR514_03385, partial [Chthoniobacterales bacterium]